MNGGEKMYYVGLDLGTSSVKLCLIDERYNLLKESARSYELEQPFPNWKEISPEVWWSACCEALADLLCGIDAARVKYIGVTGQMHSLILLDESGKPVRPAMMWNDTRTADLIPSIKSAMAGTDVDYLSKIASTGSPAANMLWVRENEPDNFARIKKFLIGPDYVVYRLTGAFGTDFCEASTSSMYDTVNKRWSPVVSEFLRLPASAYPEVKGSAQIAGLILPELAEKFGLRSDTAVIVGTGDNPASAIPTGCLGDGAVVFSMGTSGVLMFTRSKLDYAAKGKNILFGLSDDKDECRVLVQGVIQSCGADLSWWNSVLGCDLAENLENTEKSVSLDDLGANAVMFYPHLVGDKTIYADPTLRGAFIGLGSDTKPAEMTLAVMEGIAFALRQLINEMNLNGAGGLGELKVIGGGSKSDLWLQILADVTNLTIARMTGSSGASFGAALLAAYANGQQDALNCAASVKQRFYPSARSTSLYENGYSRYRAIHDALKKIQKMQ